MGKRRNQLHATVPEELHDWYEDLSMKDELPIAAHVRRALKDYRQRIERMEKNYRQQIEGIEQTGAAK